MKKKIYLDDEEREIDEALESGNVVFSKLSKKEMNRLAEIARNTSAKSQSISIRISLKDLVKIKARALHKGMPYQTLISSVIHKEAEKI